MTTKQQDKHNLSSSLWQHPYVDVFKHFKVGSDWKQSKKQGDVSEIFAKEIGRKAMQLQGSISANNYIQLPHPQALMKGLNLSGRYIYLEVKSPNAGSPFSLHFDFGLAERSHNLRISVSNLFKTLAHANNFVLQVPMELQTEKWTVIMLDLQELMVKAELFPPSYTVEGCHTLKSMTLCANVVIRGVYTSDNVYNYQNMPTDMRFKFSHDQMRWEEFFNWQALPADWENGQDENKQSQNRTASPQKTEEQKLIRREQDRKQMEQEINTLLNRKEIVKQTNEDEDKKHKKKDRLQGLVKLDHNLYQSEHQSSGPQTVHGFAIEESKQPKANRLSGLNRYENEPMSLGTHGTGHDLKRSAKIAVDPILELKHIIGYSGDKCLNLKWSRIPGENQVIFTSGGTLISMEVRGADEQHVQKRFFFGHSAPICCFDLNANGTLVASAQEGKNSLIRIWDYLTCRCISMLTMPVNSLKCLSFSHDGKYLASVGKDSHNREMINVWDITQIGKGEKPQLVAKQTSDFNILCLKFSPIDSSRMASCGRENIRFWRIRDQGSIRGSAVVLNHHARNTIFTSLDFENGFISMDPKENESLKRLFVASKHGMLFQINYHTEALEGAYQLHDAAIFSVSVNEAFCVTGSEDSYLRVWPLDFSEFFMEAKHEGTVSAVDIAPDGLKVVCGTLYGSLGVLDKSNQKYRTLLRSHTDDVLFVDYHMQKRNVITVSRDKTIRLWDVQNFDQVYEFSSPVDQPLCVSAHPELPLFACGFQSGVMRIFDIERTCVADEFSQFNQPIKKIKYSPVADLVISCCQDGGVAIHNAKRQHLPIKMLHLEFPPEHVHAAFTQALPASSQINKQGEDGQQVEDSSSIGAMFGTMGENGNSVNIYSTETFVIKHQIQSGGHILREFQFTNNNREIVLITNDCRVRFHSLAKYEGIFLRELSSVHRGNIMSASVSSNSGFLLTGGEDHMIKVWDYEANKATPQYFQAFIGHTYPVNQLLFCQGDNTLVLSAGETDGIYIWSFYGDVKNQYAFSKGEEQQRYNEESKIQIQLKSPSRLEKMRNNRKESKNQQAIKEGQCFQVPELKALDLQDYEPDEIETQQNEGFKFNDIYTKKRKEKGLNYVHFVHSDPTYENSISQSQSVDQIQMQNTNLAPTIANGYSGNSGIHNNLVWNAEQGWFAYTLNNKIIIEKTKTREQTILSDSTVLISTLALSPCRQFLAAGEGHPNVTGNSQILLYNVGQAPYKLIQKMTFHQRGVQDLQFSNDSKQLISIGCAEENTIAIWELSSGLVLTSTNIKSHATNMLRIDPYVEDRLEFTTVGTQGKLTLWKYDFGNKQFQYFDAVVPKDIRDKDFVSVCYTQYLTPFGSYLLMIGLNDGSIISYDLKHNHFVDQQCYVMKGELGSLVCNNSFMVIGSQYGSIARYQIQQTAGSLYPHDEVLSLLQTDSAIVSISMDGSNNEGLVGTYLGSIYYINFNERSIVKLVSTIQNKIVHIAHANQILLASSGQNLRLFASQTVDQVMRFPCLSAEVVHVLINPKDPHYCLCILKDGIIHLISIDTLQIEGTVQLELAKDDAPTTAAFSPNGLNFAIATLQGQILFGQVPDSRSLTVGSALLPPSDSITSIQFSTFDPVGTMVVANQTGKIKLYQSMMQQNQYLRLGSQSPSKKEQQAFDDIDQYEQVDTFDMFENPHGVPNMTREEQQQLQILYSGKKYLNCEAKFALRSADIYFSYVSALQYVFVRNFVLKSIIRRISLLHFPTSMVFITDLKLPQQIGHKVQTSGEQAVLAVGTQDGKILGLKVDAQSTDRIFEVDRGMVYGPVASLHYQGPRCLVVGAQTGELSTFDLEHFFAPEI